MTHTWRTGRTVSCCYECERRQPGCHAECEEYQQFAAQQRLSYAERQRYSSSRDSWRKERAPKKMFK